MAQTYRPDTPTVNRSLGLPHEPGSPGTRFDDAPRSSKR
jgi:hypothetical protein